MIYHAIIRSLDIWPFLLSKTTILTGVCVCVRVRAFITALELIGMTLVVNQTEENESIQVK